MPFVLIGDGKVHLLDNNNKRYTKYKSGQIDDPEQFLRDAKKSLWKTAKWY